MKYVGIWLGQAIVLDKSQGPLAKLVVKAHLLASLPLKAEGKSRHSIPGCTRFLDTLRFSFFPRNRSPGKTMWYARGAGYPEWVLPTTHWKVPHDRGGYALGMAGNFLL